MDLNQVSVPVRDPALGPHLEMYATATSTALTARVEILANNSSTSSISGIEWAMSPRASWHAPVSVSEVS